METIYLQGTETIARAGSDMNHAAQEMRHAASEISQAVETLRLIAISMGDALRQFNEDFQRAALEARNSADGQ